MATKGLYKGFAFSQFEKNKSFKLNDIELVKADITNHFFTRKGERAMMPNFGCNIPDLLFEPMDEIVLSEIFDEAKEILDYDPRVLLNNLRLVPIYEESAVVVVADLDYVEFKINDVLSIRLEFEV